MQTSPHRSGRRGLAAVLTAVLVACLVSLAGITHAHAAPGDGSVSDPNIAYVGRWDTSSGTTAVANWTGAYVQTSFTGTTVKVKARTRSTSTSASTADPTSSTRAYAAP